MKLCTLLHLLSALCVVDIAKARQLRWWEMAVELANTHAGATREPFMLWTSQNFVHLSTSSLLRSLHGVQSAVTVASAAPEHDRLENAIMERAAASVVVLLENSQPVEELREALETMKLYAAWTPRARHLAVVVQENEPENEPEDKAGERIRALLEEFWSRKVYWAAVTFTTTDENSGIHTIANARRKICVTRGSRMMTMMMRDKCAMKKLEQYCQHYGSGDFFRHASNHTVHSKFADLTIEMKTKECIKFYAGNFHCLQYLKKFCYEKTESINKRIKESIVDSRNQKHVNYGAEKEYMLLAWGRPIGGGQGCSGYKDTSILWMRISEERLHKYAETIPFQNEIFPNLGGCSLVVSAMPWAPLAIESTPKEDKGKNISTFDTGIDVEIYKEAGKKMNFTVQYLPTEILNWTYALSVVNLGFANLSNGMWPYADKYVLLDATVPYWPEKGVWFVPKPDSIPRWQSIVTVFTRDMWMAVFGSLACVCLTFFIFKQVGASMPSAFSREPFHDSYDTFYICITLLCVPLTRRPEGVLVRLFFTTWVLCCIVINAGYQSALISFLSNPGMYPPLKTLDDLFGRKFTFGLVSDWKEFLNEAEEQDYKRVFTKYIDCVNVSECIDRVIQEGDMAVPIEETFVEYDINVRYKIVSKDIIAKLPKPLASYNTVMYLQKYSPLLDGLNFVITNVHEYGIIKKWLSDLSRSFGLSHQQSNANVVMTLSHLQGVFFLWIVGILVATIALTVEYSYAIWFSSFVRNWSGSDKSVSKRKRYFLRNLQQKN